MIPQFDPAQVWNFVLRFHRPFPLPHYRNRLIDTESRILERFTGYLNVTDTTTTSLKFRYFFEKTEILPNLQFYVRSGISKPLGSNPAKDINQEFFANKTTNNVKIEIICTSIMNINHVLIVISSIELFNHK